MNTKQRAVSQNIPSDTDRKNEIKGYGPHLTYDGYEADHVRLNDMQVVFEFLLKLPAVIGMQRLTQPYVISYDGADMPNDYGVTGVVIIATSHISIHTYPYDKTFFLDIFSCKAFDQEKALAFIRKTFEAKKEDVQLTVRGKRFRQ
ncbi:MAG: S-adenosylmethionine decarboxylase [Patescibacteria group bacterium]